MILNGHLLHSYQTCARRHALESLYRYLPHHPNTLLSTVLRRAIYDLSQGRELHPTTTTAVHTFVSNSKHPGLDLPPGLQPYTLAMDCCACIRTILEHFHRTPLPRLCLRPNTPVSDDLEWSYLSFSDQSGSLHRYKFVDSISDPSVLTELHSWEVFGDLAVSSSPMTLHLVSIGRRDGSRRSSPWCRTYRSPAMNTYKFQKKSGQSLGESWKPMWFADNPNSDPEVWVDLMEADGILDSLVRTVSVRQPDPIHVLNFLRDLKSIAAQMQSQSSIRWFEQPMSRPSCDSPYVCPHQSVCYSTDPEHQIRTCGLYEVRRGLPQTPSV